MKIVKKRFEYEEMKRFFGKVKGNGINQHTNSILFWNEGSKKVHKMIIDIIRVFDDGEWDMADPNKIIKKPIKIVIEYNNESNFAIDYMCDWMMDYNDDDINLQLFPFDDGLMINALTVKENKRGQGIGTEVMNKLYDISEKMEIPLYIIPFPSEEGYEQSTIYDIIKPLHKWYDKIGFGPVENRFTLWSNY